MTERLSLNTIEYFDAIERATKESSDSDLDLKVMDYISNIVSRIDEEDIKDLSERGIIDLDYKMTSAEGERKIDEVTMANNGEHLVIIQVINSLEEAEKRRNDELQIGIILDRAGRLIDITVLQKQKNSIEKEKFYREVLKTAEKIYKSKKQEEAKGIKKIQYKIKNFLLGRGKETQPKSLKTISLANSIELFKETTGEDAQEAYIREKEKKMRSEKITHTVTPLARRLIAELSITEEQRGKMEEEARRQRAEIVMTQYDGNKENDGNR